MAQSHFQSPFLTAAVAAIVSASPAIADEAEDEKAANLAELRATITAIVEAQTLASRETHDWQARKAIMGELLDIHRREIELLTEELNASGQSAPGHSEAVTQAKDDIAALRETRATLTAAVERARPRVIALAIRFPAPLAAEITSELATLENWTTGDEPRDALQSLLAILSKANQFNRRITRALEVVNDREAEVLYLGLASAFYADRSGNAGIGTPAASGWKWQADPSINRQVLRAFEILDQKRPPARVELPLHIE